MQCVVSLWRPLRDVMLAVAVVLIMAACDAVPATQPGSVISPTPGGASAATSPDPSSQGGPIASPSAGVSPVPTPRVTARPTVKPTPKPTPTATPAGANFAGCPGRIPSGHPVGTGISSPSRNWAGYAAASPAGGVTCVEATWVQPTVRCPATGTRAMAIWVGIGGYYQAGLVQLGTEASCRDGASATVSWRESLPQEPSVVATGLHVRAGHRIHAQVRWVKGSRYRLSMADLSNGEVFTMTVTNSAVRRTSAEWIVEAPSTGCQPRCKILSMPRFSTVTFSGAWTSWGSVKEPLDGASFTHDQITMTSSGGAVRAAVIATGSDGRSFRVAFRRA